MVPADSGRVSRAPPYSGYCWRCFLAPKGLSPSAARLSRRVRLRTQLPYAALQPRDGLDRRGLGYSRFARRYSGNRFFFLFLRLLRCFSSAGWLPRKDIRSRGWVVPFGDPRVDGRVRLTGAFRSLPRPSSPLRA
jgi:hypothetical protein